MHDVQISYVYAQFHRRGAEQCCQIAATEACLAILAQLHRNLPSVGSTLYSNQPPCSPAGCQFASCYQKRMARCVLPPGEQQEIAMEQIGEDVNRRLLYWEAAEGGNGIWRRLIEYPDALARVAEKALDACHFDPGTGEERPGWAERCSRACYDCLLSYSNQPAHPLIDRHLIREFLLTLLKSTTKKKSERSREEQYAWLEERRDQNSTLERDFLRLVVRHSPATARSRSIPPRAGGLLRSGFLLRTQSIAGRMYFLRWA